MTGLEAQYVAFMIQLQHYCGSVSDKPVPRSRYTASSNEELARNAKVDTAAATEGLGSTTPGLNAWSPDESDGIATWLEIDFDVPVTVVEVLTQGSVGDDKWTTSYVLQYSTDERGAERKWTFVKEKGSQVELVSSVRFLSVKELRCSVGWKVLWREQKHTVQ